MTKSSVFAAIDIGSSSSRLQIIEVTEDGKTEQLENVTKSVPVGKDTFTTGRISASMVDSLANALTGFKKLMREYRVHAKRVVATSSFREAKNRDYVIEQIRVRTGLLIEILNPSEELYLTQLSAMQNLPENVRKKNGGILYAHIGSGNTHFSVYNAEGMKYSHATQLGPLRIQQMLSSLEGETLHYSSVLEEYIRSHVDSLFAEDKRSTLKTYCVSGRICEALYYIREKKMPRKKIYSLRTDEFEELYGSLLNLSASQISDRFNLERSQADLLVPALIMIHTFIQDTNAKEILFLFANLMDGVLKDLINKSSRHRDPEEENNILSCARNLSLTFRCDQLHAGKVEELAAVLYDVLGKTYSISARELLLLRTAAILHDSGKFLNLIDHAKNSAALIRSCEFTGLSEKEQLLIALMCYYHEDGEIIRDDQALEGLDVQEMLTLSKLSCILRLANALDYSHHQKISSIEASIRSGKLNLRLHASHDITLEKWKLQDCSETVADVFGLKLQIIS